MNLIPRIMNGKGRMAFVRTGLIPFLVLIFLTLSTFQAMGATDMSAMDNMDCSAQVSCSACVSPVLPESPQSFAFLKVDSYGSDLLIAFPEKHLEVPYHPPR